MQVVALKHNRRRKNIQECFIVKSKPTLNKESTRLQAFSYFRSRRPKVFLENNFPENCEKVLRKTSVMKSFVVKHCYVTDIFVVVEIFENYLEKQFYRIPVNSSLN